MILYHLSSCSWPMVLHISACLPNRVYHAHTCKILCTQASGFLWLFELGHRIFGLATPLLYLHASEPSELCVVCVCILQILLIELLIHSLTPHFIHHFPESAELVFHLYAMVACIDLWPDQDTRHTYTQ